MTPTPADYDILVQRRRALVDARKEVIRKSERAHAATEVWKATHLKNIQKEIDAIDELLRDFDADL